LNWIALVERQILHLRFIDRRRNFGCAGLHLLRIRADFNGLNSGTDGQLDVEPYRLAGK